MTKTLHKKISVSKKQSKQSKQSKTKRLQTKRMKQYSRKNTKQHIQRKRSTKPHSKKTRVLQSGGNFNPQETEELHKILKDMNLFSEKEISDIVEKMNLSSQFFTGPYFSQLTVKMADGNFRNKEEFMKWLNDLFPKLEENVETDVEYDENDDDDNY